MILKNFLLYLQVFTLPASFTSENTDARSNQREESELKSVHNSRGQYGPGDMKSLKNMMSIEENKESLLNSRSQKYSYQKYIYGPEVPVAKMLENEPIWIKNIAKHFKDKFLLEEYRRDEKAIYPLKPTFIQGLNHLHPEYNLELDGKQRIKKDGIDSSTIGEKQFDYESPGNAINANENVTESILESSEVHDTSVTNKTQGESKQQQRIVCFVDDLSKMKSILVPCHFVSRAFYYMLFLDRSSVEVQRSDNAGLTSVSFSCDLKKGFLNISSSQPSPTSDDVHTQSPEIPVNRSQIEYDLTINENLTTESPASLKKEEEELTSVSKAPAKPEDDISAPKKDSEMPSFDEWKMQQEEEKNKDQKELNSFPNHVKQKVPKKEINYASVTCGAKVIQANPEAQNPSFILYENKDQYMINPCSVKKGFTVELCEAIQVQAVQLGNTEFFSSLPQSFDVHISERFPVKEWIHVGAFQAKNERTIQNFPVQSSLAFAKYIRIDILSHYGNEHFCPLSVLRVFGVSLDDDEEVETSQDETDYSDIIDVTVPLDSGDRKANNLFSKATDTVISIMKTVLPSTAIEPENSSDTNKKFQSDPKFLNITLSDKELKPTPESIMDRCLYDQESLPFFNSLSMHLSVLDLTCQYYRLMSGSNVHLMCPNVNHSSLVGLSSNVSMREDATVKIPTIKNEKFLSGNEVFEGVEEVTNLDGISKKDMSDTFGSEAKTVDRLIDKEDKMDRVITEASIEKNEKPLDCNDQISKEEVGQNIDSKDSSSDQSHNNDLEGSKRSVTNVSHGSTSAIHSGTSVSEGGETSTNQKKEVVSNDGTASSRLEPLKDYEFDAPNMDDVTYQKLSSKGKESVFAKLKNRIKTLEISLNLTNRYLEELSQRYKKQTEEMYTSLNKTISKLINTAKSAEERDLRQQDRIQSLEIRFSNLSGVLSSLHRSFQDIHSQVLERHLILMAVEFALFFALLTYCQGSRRLSNSFDPHSRRSSAPAVPGKSLTSNVLMPAADNKGDVQISVAEKAGVERLTFPGGDEAHEVLPQDPSHPQSCDYEEIMEHFQESGENDGLSEETSVVSNFQIEKDLVSMDMSSLSQVEDSLKTKRELGCLQDGFSVKDAAMEEYINDRLVFVDNNYSPQHNRYNSQNTNRSAHSQSSPCKNDVQPKLSLTRDISHLPRSDDLWSSKNMVLFDRSNNEVDESKSSSNLPVDWGSFEPQDASKSEPCAFPLDDCLLRLNRKKTKKEKKRHSFCYFSSKKLSNWTRRYSEYLGSRSIGDLASQYYPQEADMVVHVKFCS